MVKNVRNKHKIKSVNNSSLSTLTRKSITNSRTPGANTK